MTYTRLARKTALAWAAGEYGNPIAAAAYRVADLNFDNEKANALANNNFVGAYHPGPNRPGGRWMDVAFTSELRGSLTADVPPPEGTLLRACGFTETPSGTTPAIVYSYILGDPHIISGDPAGDLDPIDLVINVDRLVRTAASAVGNVVFNFTAGQIATMGFVFRGNVGDPAVVGSEDDPASFTVGSAPVPVQNYGLTITPSGSSAVASLIMPSLIFDCGNIIDPRDDINGASGYSGPILTGRVPAITLVVEAPVLATIDFEDLYIDQTELDFAFTHNDGGGIREELAVSFTAVIAEFPVPSEMNGKMVYTLALQASVASGATPLTLAWAAS